jgi:hypothetical protein
MGNLSWDADLVSLFQAERGFNTARLTSVLQGWATDAVDAHEPTSASRASKSQQANSHKTKCDWINSQYGKKQPRHDLGGEFRSQNDNGYGNKD